jgi:large subunit ribosomal protein L32e
MNLLKLRKRVKKRKPDFRRQESFREKRLGTKWRRPRGRHSKLRIERKVRGRKPKPSYSSPKAVRGLGPGGLREIRVFTPGDLKGIDPAKEAVIIGGSVGKAKREAIVKRAGALKIRVLNL